MDASQHFLSLDPELVASVAASQRTAAARIRVHVRAVERGPWSGAAADLERSALGLFVVSGYVVRNVVVGSRTVADLAGPGDVLLPWRPAGPILTTVSWNAVAPARIVALDTDFMQAVAPFPELIAAVAGRAGRLSTRIVLTRGIAAMSGIELRLLSLLWLYAEYWGRVVADGVRLPVPLTHELIAQLLGARRQTVTTAATKVAAAGLVSRDRRGRWTLIPPEQDAFGLFEWLLDPRGAMSAAAAMRGERQSTSNDVLRGELLAERQRLDDARVRFREAVRQLEETRRQTHLELQRAQSLSRSMRTKADDTTSES